MDVLPNMPPASLAIPRLIAHRGAKANAPENTLAAFARAREEGALWVEFDVKLTADGVPVVIHDEMLERTTDGRGAVRSTSLAALKRLDAGAWFAPAFRGERVPTLVEALDLFARLDMGFNLEIKPCPGREVETARTTIAVLDAHWPANRPAPVLSSFKAEALAAVRDLAPRYALGYLAEKLGQGWIEAAQRLGCKTVHPGWHSLTEKQIGAAKAAGFPLLVWTVNEPARARQLLAWGVDALITDNPGDLAAAIER